MSVSLRVLSPVLFSFILYTGVGDLLFSWLTGSRIGSGEPSPAGAGEERHWRISRGWCVQLEKDSGVTLCFEYHLPIYVDDYIPGQPLCWTLDLLSSFPPELCGWLFHQNLMQMSQMKPPRAHSPHPGQESAASFSPPPPGTALLSQGIQSVSTPFK